jgi:orotidine-5'-phosphate decarboxylase
VSARAPIAVALDAADLALAERWAVAVAPHVQCVKVGLEMFAAHGPSAVGRLRDAARGCDLFLDLKLHDIPNTVAGAARAVAGLRPRYLTVHASGGPAVIRAAADAAPDVRITAITVLTSLSAPDLHSVGFAGSPIETVERLAVLAVGAGARALVCSPAEVAVVRGAVGPDVVLITPGVRPAGSASADQARVATPEAALRAGADLLVIGRPITGAADVGAAARQIAGALAS